MRPMNLANKKFVPTPYLFTQTNKLGEHQVGAESFHFSYLWEKMGFLEKSRLGWKVLHWLSTGLELASWQSLNQHWRLSHLCKQSGVSFVAVTNQNQLFRMFVEIITFTWYSSRIWILAALVVWGNKTDQEIISSCVIHWYSFQKASSQAASLCVLLGPNISQDRSVIGSRIRQQCQNSCYPHTSPNCLSRGQ